MVLIFSQGFYRHLRPIIIRRHTQYQIAVASLFLPNQLLASVPLLIIFPDAETVKTVPIAGRMITCRIRCINTIPRTQITCLHVNRIFQIRIKKITDIQISISGKGNMYPSLCGNRLLIVPCSLIYRNPFVHIITTLIQLPRILQFNILFIFLIIHNSHCLDSRLFKRTRTTGQ